MASEGLGEMTQGIRLGDGTEETLIRMQRRGWDLHAAGGKEMECANVLVQLLKSRGRYYGSGPGDNPGTRGGGGMGLILLSSRSANKFDKRVP